MYPNAVESHRLYPLMLIWTVLSTALLATVTLALLAVTGLFFVSGASIFGWVTLTLAFLCSGWSLWRLRRWI